MQKNLLSLFLMTAAIFSIASVVRADGVTVSPSFINEKIEPGTSYSADLTVMNLSATAEKYYILVRDIATIDDGGKPIFAKDEEPTGYEISSWVKPSREFVEVGPGGSGKIGITINVPAGASPGGHYGAVFFAREADRFKVRGATVGYQVGTILNFRIAGDIREEADIREFRTDKNMYSSADVQFTTRVTNGGNVVVRPLGPITITDMWGREVGKVIVNETAQGVFPNGAREFVNSWKSDGFYFGRFDAVVSLAYGEEGGRQSVSQAVSFWILPLHIILPVVGGLLLLILLIYVFVKFHINRKIKQITEATKGIKGEGAGVAGVAPDHDLVMYGKEQPMSRLWVTAVAMLIFIMTFALLLFFFFA